MRISGGESPRAPKPYNPLEKRRLAESIVRELLECDAERMPPDDPFIGAGIYLIYYKGNLSLYEPLAQLNRKLLAYPIYVGQAVTPGGRKGSFSDMSTSPALFKRLSEHVGSIRQKQDLKLEDFFCRYLVIDEFWISLAESLLIESYRPLWNVIVDGFGNHDPGAGRHRGKRTSWDTLHPGRAWAERLQPRGLTRDQIERKVSEHLLELSRPDTT